MSTARRKRSVAVALLNCHCSTADPGRLVQGNLARHRWDSETSDWSLLVHGFSDREPAPEEFRALDAFKVHPVSATYVEKAFDQVLAGAGYTNLEEYLQAISPSGSFKWATSVECRLSGAWPP